MQTGHNVKCHQRKTLVSRNGQQQQRLMTEPWLAKVSSMITHSMLLVMFVAHAALPASHCLQAGCLWNTACLVVWFAPG